MGDGREEIDFEVIDRGTRFKHKESRLMCAHRDKCDFISEHIVKTYRKTKSLRETGKICGDISTIAVRTVLTKCDEPLRNPGGRVWSKLSDDDVRLIRSQTYVNHQVYLRLVVEIQNRLKDRYPGKTDKQTSISIETIRDVWKKKTHQEVI